MRLRRRRRWLAPSVIQTSALDCGPAALASVLEGYGLPAGYERLRDLCHTDVDGTSIDALETVAQRLGVQATQVVVPEDHVFLGFFAASDRHRPASQWLNPLLRSVAPVGALAANHGPGTRPTLGLDTSLAAESLPTSDQGTQKRLPGMDTKRRVCRGPDRALQTVGHLREDGARAGHGRPGALRATCSPYSTSTERSDWPPPSAAGERGRVGAAPNDSLNLLKLQDRKTAVLAGAESISAGEGGAGKQGRLDCERRGRGQVRTRS